MVYSAKHAPMPLSTMNWKRGLLRLWAVVALLVSSAFILTGCDDRRDLRDCLLAKQAWAETSERYRAASEQKNISADFWLAANLEAARLESLACPKGQ